MRQNQYGDINVKPFKSVITTLLLTVVVLLFLRCDQEKECFDNNNCKVLSNMEAVMLQHPEVLENLLSQLDTVNMTSHERARHSTIKGLIYNNKEEYLKSIKELEEAALFFSEKDDQYHIHLNKLVRAFASEHLRLYVQAQQLFEECERYFEYDNLDKLSFHVNLGYLRLSKHLHVEAEPLINKLKNKAKEFNKPYYNALLYAALAVESDNDSIRYDYLEKTRTEFYRMKRWSSVYGVELNLLFIKFRLSKPERLEVIYNDFTKKGYQYTPTNRQRVRYMYAKAYYLSKLGRIKEATVACEEALEAANRLKTKQEGVLCRAQLVNLYKFKGDYKKEAAVLKKIITTDRTELKLQEQGQLLALGAQYNIKDEQREKLNFQRVNKRLWVFFVIGVSLSLCFMGVFLYKQRQLKCSRQEKLKLHNDKCLLEIRLEAIKEERKTLNREKESLTKELTEIYDNRNKMTMRRHIKRGFQKREVKKQGEFDAWFESKLPGWRNKLQRKYPKITNNDIHYCRCFYLELNNEETAAINSVTKSGVMSVKRRLLDKLSVESFDEVILILDEI
ncbi:hypothetical protein EYV94_11080 [Puteibacter caeruleilacunae]|nr:hypothetical protein EYV94_11080 [Puteibacter caeruleilacunae]